MELFTLDLDELFQITSGAALGVDVSSTPSHKAAFLSGRFLSLECLTAKIH